MKKILIIIAVLIALFIVALFLIPILFKSQIVEIVKAEANKQLNATLNFEDVNLSLFNNFPQITASVDELTIINHAPFAGDTLLYLEEFQATLNLASLVFGGEIEIISIQLLKPHFNLIMSSDSSVNWDIVPVDTAVTADSAEAPAFSMAIQQYEITGASLVYTDHISSMVARISGLNHKGQGDFDQSIFTLTTHTDIEDLTVSMDDIAYLNKAEMEIEADLEMDMENLKFTFKENEIRLNQLFLNITGWVSMPNETDIEMDLNFAASKADFKNILSMVPVIYMEDFGELEADGQLSLSGNIRGKYNDYTVPNFNIDLGVQNGMFQYPELPTPVKNVSVDLNVNNTGRDLDDMIVDLKKFHMEILDEPIDLQLTVKTPMSDPFIDAKFTGRVNLANAQNALPIQQEFDLAGTIVADFRFQGKMSDIEAQRADRLTATGNIKASNINYASADLPEAIQIKDADLRMSAYNAALNKFEMKMGESDLSANGGLDNIVGFVLTDQTLKGSLNVKSNYLDLTPWMIDTLGQAAGDTTALVAIEVPDKIEFVMTADFKKIKMDNIVMNNTRGKIIVKDQKANMVDLRSDLVGGSMVANGTYEYFPPAKPRIDFDLEITNFSIPEMYGTFVTVKTVAPLTKYLKGNMSGKMKLNSELGDSLTPDFKTIFSKGSVAIPQAKLEGFDALNQMSDLLKIKELKDPVIKNFSPSYTVEDGRLHFNQVSYNLDKYKAKTSGSIGFDESLNLAAILEIPSTELGAILNQDLSLLKGQVTEVPANIGGSIKSPKVNIPLDQVTGNLLGQLKQAGLKAADDKKKEYEDKAKEEVEKKIEEGADKVKDKLKDLFGK